MKKNNLEPSTASAEPKPLVRLHKVIANRGYCSRREAERLIKAGKVKVNQMAVSEVGFKVDPDSIITVDGKLVQKPSQKYYFAFNKPIKCVTTMSDPQHRPTVKDYLKAIPARVYPIGRLDYDSEGLLLLTNDGDFAQAVAHPRFKLPKTYAVTIYGCYNQTKLKPLTVGVKIDQKDPVKGKIKKVIVNKQKQETEFEITITEGKNRQIRKMVKTLGTKVIKLVRLQIGPVKLGKLKPGELRPLSPAAIKSILAMTTAETESLENN